jgi:hypothetical protein
VLSSSNAGAVAAKIIELDIPMQNILKFDDELKSMESKAVLKKEDSANY